MLETIDPPTKLHSLDSSWSLFLVFGLHAAFNYHTTLGPYTTDNITSSTCAYLIVPMMMKAKTELVYHSSYKAWTNNPNFMH